MQKRSIGACQAAAAAILLSAVNLGAQANPRANQPPPDAEVFVAALASGNGTLQVSAPRNITRREGYDNQPSWMDASTILFTVNRGEGHTDIYRHDIRTGATTVVRATAPESEYSVVLSRDGRAMNVIRVEADSTQRLWRLALDGKSDRPLFPDIRPVGYFAQASDSVWAMFVLGSPATLQLATEGRGDARIVAQNIGRSLQQIPGTARVSYVQRGEGGGPSALMALDTRTGSSEKLVAMMPRSEYVAWLDGQTALAGQGTKLYMWRAGESDWREVSDFAGAGFDNITRLAVSPDGKNIAFVADVRSR